MPADVCVEAPKKAIVRFGAPEIVNTDQGSQFTGTDWITTLTEAGVRISMGGRGRRIDNIFPLIVCLANDYRAVIERLWRSLKQEAIYLEELADGFTAHRVIRNWVTFYNTERPHSALERRTPREAYWLARDEKLAA